MYSLLFSKFVHKKCVVSLRYRPKGDLRSTGRRLCIFKKKKKKNWEFDPSALEEQHLSRDDQTVNIQYIDISAFLE